MARRDAAYMERQKGAAGESAAMQKRYDAEKTAKAAQPSGFKTGGTVKKTGMAKVHKGEKIIPKRKK